MTLRASDSRSCSRLPPRPVPQSRSDRAKTAATLSAYSTSSCLLHNASIHAVVYLYPSLAYPHGFMTLDGARRRFTLTMIARNVPRPPPYGTQGGDIT
jgi:hypothetical protein